MTCKHMYTNLRLLYSDNKYSIINVTKLCKIIKKKIF